MIKTPSVETRYIREKSYPNFWTVVANSWEGIKSDAAPPIKFKFSSTMGRAIDNPMFGELNTKI